MRKLCIALGIVMPLSAAADTRTTTTQVTLRKRAGEKAAALVVLPAGTQVEVVREEGRWAVVRANGTEGYTPRTTLSAPAAAPSTTPVWSAERRAGGAQITTTRLDTSADKGGAAEPAKLWHPARQHLALRADAGIGYRSLGMDLTSNSDGGLSNYLVDADAIALTAALDATLYLAGPWLVGADGMIAASRSSPGIDYPGPTSAAGQIPFRTIAGELGVRGGRRLGTALELSLRVAGHYDAFLTSEVDNAGMLPRERLLGATAGLRLEVRPPTSRFSATVRGDALVFGTRAQTPGLEDGTSSTARAVWAGVTVRVAISQRWTVFGAYDFARMSTEWSGMSMRQPGVTSTERIDTGQLAQLGVGAEL